MAEEVITFASDLSQVRRDLQQFSAEVSRTPVNIGGARIRSTAQDFAGFWNTFPAGSSVGGVSTAALASASGAAFGASLGSSGSAATAIAGGTGSGGIAQAGASVAAALTSVAQQIRVAGGVMGVPAAGGGMASSGMPLPFQRGNVPLMLPHRGSGGGGGLVVSGPAGGGAGNSSPLPVQVRRVAAAGGGGGGMLPPASISIPGASAGGGGGPGSSSGPAAGGGRPGGANPLTPSLSSFRGLMYSLGVMEASRALSAEAVGKAQSRYASTPVEALDAELGIIDTSTSGVFGTMAGLAADIPGHLRRKFGVDIGGYGPTDARVDLVEARARHVASIRSQQDYRANQASGRILAGGYGAFGQRSASIENQFASEMGAISDERSGLSPAMLAERQRGFSFREATATEQRDFQRRQLTNDVNDRIAAASFNRQVAQGAMTSGTAQRLNMVRQWARMPVGSDDARVMDAEIGAFDAQEGYRIWQREWSAGIGAQSARDRFNLRPNVANVREIYGSGVLAQEDARRSGSAREAELIGQQTNYELAGYARNMLNSGRAVYTDNPAVLDIGQAGSSGRASDKIGDDMSETLKMIQGLLGDKLMPILQELRDAI